jgi:hypothetical protein
MNRSNLLLYWEIKELLEEIDNLCTTTQGLQSIDCQKPISFGYFHVNRSPVNPTFSMFFCEIKNYIKNTVCVKISIYLVHFN